LEKETFLRSEIFKLLCQVKQFLINYFDFLLIHNLLGTDVAVTRPRLQNTIYATDGK
jgi:hypothetical protein